MDLENDKRYPTFKVFYKIVHALDFSADHIFWLEKIPYSPGQEQLFRTIQSCDKRDPAVFMKTTWAYIRALQREKGARFFLSRL